MSPQRVAFLTLISLALFAFVSCGKFGKLKRKIKALEKKTEKLNNNYKALGKKTEKFNNNFKEQAWFVWQWSEWSECFYGGIYGNPKSRYRIGQNCFEKHCLGKDVEVELCTGN